MAAGYQDFLIPNQCFSLHSMLPDHSCSNNSHIHQSLHSKLMDPSENPSSRKMAVSCLFPADTPFLRRQVKGKDHSTGLESNNLGSNPGVQPTRWLFDVTCCTLISLFTAWGRAAAKVHTYPFPYVTRVYYMPMVCNYSPGP